MTRDTTVLSGKDVKTCSGKGKQHLVTLIKLFSFPSFFSHLKFKLNYSTPAFQSNIFVFSSFGLISIPLTSDEFCCGASGSKFGLRPSLPCGCSVMPRELDTGGALGMLWDALERSRGAHSFLAQPQM